MHGKIPASMALKADENADDSIDLRQIQDFFWRRWKLILAVAAAVMALAFVVLLTLTPRYTATAQVLLEQRKEKIFGSDQILPELSLETGSVDSQVSVLQSINLLRRVVEKQKLIDDPEFGRAARGGLFSFLAGLFKGENEDKVAAAKPDGGVPPDILAAITKLRAALDVQRVNRTYVLAISVTSADRSKAVRLANAVADAYVVDQLDARYDAAKRASTWLAERMEALRQQLQQSEEAVAKFRHDNNLVATSSEGKVTVTEQQLSELNAKLIAARAETAERRAKYEQAAQITSRGGNIQAIPDVVHSTVIGDLRKQQAEVTRKEADLIAHYGAQHPLIINAHSERRDIERSIAAEVQRILLNLKNDFDVAKAREQSLQASVDQVTGATGLDNSIGVRLRELERINTANKTLFENFLSRAKITQEQASFEEREARVISPATTPSAPSFPKKTLTGALAGVVGLLLGIGGGVALDMLNAGFSSSREIEEKLGLPVLASVPLLTAKDRGQGGVVLDPPHYLAARPFSRYAEAVRALRMGVQMADVDNPPKVVLITSAVPKEGKSTLAQSLAFSAVKAGQRVLLLDCDLRHPSSSKFFEAETKGGLVDYLTGDATFEEIAVHREGLVVIPAGSKSQNPPDLLGSERMRQLINNLRSGFDYIVIDAPPMAPVIDAKVLSNLADKIIFVIRWQATAREIAAHQLSEFARSHQLAGVALNLVDEDKAPRYGAYGQYSGYYYKSYYHN